MRALFAPFGRYKKDATLSVIGTVGEVVMEVFIPFITAYLIDRGIEAGDMDAVIFYGILMLAMAFLSLGFGLLAGYFSATAATGYACSLREAIFDKVQTYSFGNIDKFSTAGLVTRMTTDVTNIQNAALMLLRIAVRTPVMLISSLVNLLSRLYDVTAGSVRVGGIDVRAYDLACLRDNVAVVLQKNVLFSGTIAENLRWGNEDATDEELMAACRAASADEFVTQLADGLNARVERGGVNFSGGQKQRLCIARALLKRPKVLILDDSTSAVDTTTDARIREAFRTHIPGTTKIIIAQRISSVMDADRIIVLSGGRVNGVGTHDELLETNEIYRSVYESQAEGTGDFDVADAADEDAATAGKEA